MSGTLNWERLGNRFLTNLEAPPLKWALNVEHYNIAAAECSGVIVAWPKTEGISLPITEVTNQKRKVMSIYSSNGTKLGQIPLDFGDVLDARVLPNETIIIVSTSGIVRHYVDNGLNFTQIRLETNVKKISPFQDGYFVESVEYSDEGMDAKTTISKVSDISKSEPVLRMLDTEISMFEPADWCVIEGDEDRGRPLHHLFLDTQNKLHIFDDDLAVQSHHVVFEDVPAGAGLKISPNNELLVVSNGTKLVVLTTDLFETEFEASDLPKHDEVYWVGSTALALKSYAEGGQVEVVDIQGVGETKTTSIYFDDHECVLIEEVDGLRILGKHDHSLLVPVSKATSQVFKLGSVAPGAILYSCVGLIDSASPKPEQIVNMLDKNDLTTAVDTCITASLSEIEPKIQKRLMKAALFGKSMLKVYDSTRYVDTLLYLRVGNAVRSLGDSSLFITYPQIMRLTIPNLIKRLENRQLWGEAVSLAELMRLPIEPVYIDWACSVIEKEDQASEEEIMAKLNAKLNKLTTYSTRKMAQKALEQGRQEMALSLLEKEPVVSERVALLMDMNMTHRALEQAVNSGNPYLIDYVLLILTDQLTLPQMIRIIGGNEEAVKRKKDLIEADFIASNEQSKAKITNEIHEFLHQMDLRSESVKLEFNSVSDEQDADKKIRMLQNLEKKFTSVNQKSIYESKACSEWADLLTIQKQLGETFNVELVNKSAADTIYTLLKLPQLAQAQKIKGKLGISDRQFMWLRMRALVDRHEFEELWDLSQTRKQAISFKAFFNICFEAGQKEQASRYVHLINEASIEEKVRMYIKCKAYDLARTTAGRNTDLLNLIPS